MGLYPTLPQQYQEYLSNTSELVYVKTNLGGLFFDAFLRLEHTSSLTITEHPVEIGAAVTDHAYLNPAILVMEIGMSDVSASLVEGQFEGGWSRSARAFEILQEMQRNRVPVQVVTRLKTYQNMLIETIAVPDDHTTLYGLRATVTLREVFMAQTKTVKVSANPHVTDTTPMGELPVKPVDESLWYQLGLGKGANKQ